MPQVQGPPQLHDEFKVSLGYMKPSLKKKEKKQVKRGDVGLEKWLSD